MCEITCSGAVKNQKVQLQQMYLGTLMRDGLSTLTNPCKREVLSSWKNLQIQQVWLKERDGGEKRAQQLQNPLQPACDVIIPVAGLRFSCFSDTCKKVVCQQYSATTVCDDEADSWLTLSL